MHRLRTLLPLWLALAGTWTRPCIPGGLKRFLANQRKANARRKATRYNSTRGRYDQMLGDVVRELKNSWKNPRRRAGTITCANEGDPIPIHTSMTPAMNRESRPREREGTLLLFVLIEIGSAMQGISNRSHQPTSTSAAAGSDSEERSKAR